MTNQRHLLAHIWRKILGQRTLLAVPGEAALLARHCLRASAQGEFFFAKKTILLEDCPPPPERTKPSSLIVARDHALNYVV